MFSDLGRLVGARLPRAPTRASQFPQLPNLNLLQIPCPQCSVTRVAQELVKDGEGLACPLRNPCDPNVTENLAPAGAYRAPGSGKQWQSSARLNHSALRNFEIQ